LCASFYFLIAIEWFALMTTIICVHSLLEGQNWVWLECVHSMIQHRTIYSHVIVWKSIYCSVLVLVVDFSSIRTWLLRIRLSFLPTSYEFAAEGQSKLPIIFSTIYIWNNDEILCFKRLLNPSFHFSISVGTPTSSM